MKEHTTIQKHQAFENVDKRNLVNIDLYRNEISVMEKQLDAVAEKHQSKEILKKLDHFKKKLSIQKQHLERFQHDCEPGKNIDSKEPTKGKKAKRESNEGFFEQLKTFEEEFKNTRIDVNDWVNKWM
jgi:hypothetical protein